MCHSGRSVRPAREAPDLESAATLGEEGEKKIVQLFECSG